MLKYSWLRWNNASHSWNNAGRKTQSAELVLLMLKKARRSSLSGKGNQSRIISECTHYRKQALAQNLRASVQNNCKLRWLQALFFSPGTFNPSTKDLAFVNAKTILLHFLMRCTHWQSRRLFQLYLEMIVYKRKGCFILLGLTFIKYAYNFHRKSDAYLATGCKLWLNYMVLFL